MNHPNIAAICGFEQADDMHFFAEGLEEAREQGVVHRDLKPANIKLTPEHKGQDSRLRARESVC